jgi:hypothetical protein
MLVGHGRYIGKQVGKTRESFVPAQFGCLLFYRPEMHSARSSTAAENLLRTGGNQALQTCRLKVKPDITPCMLFKPKASSYWLAASAALLGALSMPITIRAEPPAPRFAHVAPVEAQFRGCGSAGWCRFWIESLDPQAESLHRVRPDGISQISTDEAISIAVRDRLNALLADMIHQAKHIVLHDLRELDDGTFAATVTVNGANLASDPTLIELHVKLTGETR